MNIYQKKYLKYKQKYLKLKNMKGGINLSKGDKITLTEDIGTLKTGLTGIICEINEPDEDNEIFIDILWEGTKDSTSSNLDDLKSKYVINTHNNSCIKPKVNVYKFTPYTEASKSDYHVIRAHGNTIADNFTLVPEGINLCLGITRGRENLVTVWAPEDYDYTLWKNIFSSNPELKNIFNYDASDSRVSDLTTGKLDYRSCYKAGSLIQDMTLSWHYTWPIDSRIKNKYANAGIIPSNKELIFKNQTDYFRRPLGDYNPIYSEYQKRHKHGIELTPKLEKFKDEGYTDNNIDSILMEPHDSINGTRMEPLIFKYHDNELIPLDELRQINRLSELLKYFKDNKKKGNFLFLVCRSCDEDTIIKPCDILEIPGIISESIIGSVDSMEKLIADVKQLVDNIPSNIAKREPSQVSDYYDDFQPSGRKTNLLELINNFNNPLTNFTEIINSITNIELDVRENYKIYKYYKLLKLKTNDSIKELIYEIKPEYIEYRNYNWIRDIFVHFNINNISITYYNYYYVLVVLVKIYINELIMNRFGRGLLINAIDKCILIDYFDNNKINYLIYDRLHLLTTNVNVDTFKIYLDTKYTLPTMFYF